MRCGIITIVGLPNAGKSTLLNELVGAKVSIVSRKVQTTRLRVMGVVTEDDVQAIFVDTPGIFTAKSRFEKSMVAEIDSGMAGADVVLYIMDASSKGALERNRSDLERICASSSSVCVVLNKIDLMKKKDLLALAEQVSTHCSIQDIFMVSALTDDGVTSLKSYLMGRMPEGHWLYPEDQLTNLPERLFAAEITRESIFNFLHDELPYQIHVGTDKWDARKKSISIFQTVYVMTARHRAMVLGNKGQMIKRIGQAAREEIQKSLGGTIHLFLNVKVDARWQDRRENYADMGLSF